MAVLGVNEGAWLLLLFGMGPEHLDENVGSRVHMCVGVSHLIICQNPF